MKTSSLWEKISNTLSFIIIFTPHLRQPNYLSWRYFRKTLTHGQHILSCWIHNYMKFLNTRLLKSRFSYPEKLNWPIAYTDIILIKSWIWGKCWKPTPHLYSFLTDCTQKYHLGRCITGFMVRNFYFMGRFPRAVK